MLDMYSGMFLDRKSVDVERAAGWSTISECDT